jgi:hypothetical protein
MRIIYDSVNSNITISVEKYLFSIIEKPEELTGDDITLFRGNYQGLLTYMVQNFHPADTTAIIERIAPQITPREIAFQYKQ